MGKTLSCTPALTNTGGRPCVVIGKMPPGEFAITRLNSCLPFARPAVPTSPQSIAESSCHADVLLHYHMGATQDQCCSSMTSELTLS